MDIKQSAARPLTQAPQLAPTVSPGNSSTPLLTFLPGFDLPFAQRLLGRKRGGKLSAATARRLSRLQDGFGHLIRPRVTYQERAIIRLGGDSILLEGGVTLRSRKMARALAGAHKVVAFVATVGEKVDLAIEDLMQDGKVANAYVGDALGSAAVEKLANSFQEHLDNKLSVRGQTTGPRFSPGYCDWPLTEQHKLFKLVKASVAKVTLGETALMQPRKSISAIFGIYDRKAVPAAKNLIPCLRCGKKDCIARRTEADT